MNLVVGGLSHANFTFSLGCLIVSLGQAETRFTQHLVCLKIVVASIEVAKVNTIQVGSKNNFRLAGWNLGSSCI